MKRTINTYDIWDCEQGSTMVVAVKTSEIVVFIDTDNRFLSQMTIKSFFNLFNPRATTERGSELYSEDINP